VLLWDVADPAAPRRLGAPLTGHTSGVESVAFALSGPTLATASADRTAILWDFGDLLHIRDNPVANACSVAGRGFNPEEWTRYVRSLDYEDSCAT
jgi:WD40 repeat protein